MRLICFSVALLTLTASGCALTNPFAKRSPEQVYRDRLFADARAEFDRGNTEAGQRILDQLKEDAERPDLNGDSRIQQTGLQQNLPGTSQQEYDELVEMLVAMQPLSERAKKREYYRKLTAAQLRQILNSYESTHLIGQNQLQRLQGTPEGNDGRIPSTMIAGREPIARGVTAPDPGTGQLPLGAASPWPRNHPGATTPLTGINTGLAQRDPIGMTVPSGAPLGGQGGVALGATGLPGTGGQEVRTVGGVVPAAGGQNVSPLGTTPDDGSALPAINPGTAAADGMPQIFPAGSAPPPQQTGTIIQSSGVRQSSGIRAPRQSAQSPVQLLAPFGNEPRFSPTVQDPGLRNPKLQDPRLQNPGLQPGFTPQGQPVLQTPGQLPPQMTVPGQELRQGIPGRITEGVQGTISTIRDAAGRIPSSIRQLTGSPGETIAVPGTLAQVQPADVNALIAQLESQLAVSAPGETEAERLDYVRRHVNLRLLYLIAGRNDQALDPIQGIDAAHQEFWQQLVWSMASYFDAAGQPNASQRATQTVNQLRAAITRLKAGADLSLQNVSFCHKIVSFGNYERFSRDQFTPGQPVLLYAEVENFKSTIVDNDRYRTALKSTIEIHKAGVEGQPVEVIEFPVTEDLCRNYRRDYFHSYEFSVPKKVEPGLYTLVLKVQDQLGQKTSASTVNFEVE